MREKRGADAKPECPAHAIELDVLPGRIQSVRLGDVEPKPNPHAALDLWVPGNAGQKIEVRLPGRAGDGIGRDANDVGRVAAPHHVGSDGDAEGRSYPDVEVEVDVRPDRRVARGTGIAGRVVGVIVVAVVAVAGEGDAARRTN